MVDTGALCPHCNKENIDFRINALIQRVMLVCPSCGKFVIYEEVERGTMQMEEKKEEKKDDKL